LCGHFKLVFDLKKSKHLHAFNVQRITHDVPGDGDMMSDVFFESVGIVHGKDFLALIGYDHHGSTLGEAFLGACFGAGVGAFCAAFGIGNPTFDGFGLAHVIRPNGGEHEEKHRKHSANQQELFHSENSSDLAAEAANFWTKLIWPNFVWPSFRVLQAFPLPTISSNLNPSVRPL
jgi:hypothetical protein